MNEALSVVTENPKSFLLGLIQKLPNLMNSKLRNSFLFSLMSFTLGISAYHYYQQYQRKRRQEFREFQLAVERFYVIIRTINDEINQNKFMIAYYSEQFEQMHKEILTLLPENKPEENLVTSSPKCADIKWSELVRTFYGAIAEYPSIPDLVKMSPSSIDESCDLFQEYHQKIMNFSMYLAQKSAEDLQAYQSLLTRAQNLSYKNR
jgi:hypothetical protein